jgi:hypothetical protein
MESRKNSVKSTSRLSRAAELPADFSKVVREVYTTNFTEGLKVLKKFQKVKSSFEVRGAIFANEIVLGISLVTEGAMGATTIYCSVDFDPTASSPTAQDLLNICVDAVGSLFATLLDTTKPERIEQVATGSLSSFEEIPFEWTKIEFDGRRVWMLVDKSNPTLDDMTDKWLAENDPDADAEEDEYEEETKDLFMTGKGKSGRGGPLH